MSPWVVTLDSLEPVRCAAPARTPGDPDPLPHLQTTGDSAFGITLEVWLRSARMQTPMLISRGDFSQMYWTLAQMVAHHSSNGRPLRAGHLIGRGTVSGPPKSDQRLLLDMARR